jgi:TRAP-type C4-dicarboxylate transport system permease small subunit
MMIIAALIFFFMLVWGGIKYITAGGDKAQTEAARGQITAALIGLVIVFAAWAIVNLVSLFFGIDLLNLNIPNAQAT